MRFSLNMLLVLIIFVGFSTVSSAQQVDLSKINKEEAVRGPVMTFDKTMIALGEIKKGEKRSFEYNFTNTGTESLSIDFTSSCDCTTIEHPSKAFEPGESGKLKITFDSTEKEESETVDIDVFLKNVDPKTGREIFYILQYNFVLLQ